MLGGNKSSFNYFVYVEKLEAFDKVKEIRIWNISAIILVKRIFWWKNVHNTG